jgi:hypothetical protein
MGVGSKRRADSDLHGDHKATTNQSVRLEKGWSSNFNECHLP